VDVEIQFGELFTQVKRLCTTFKKLLIGSYHNFNATPDDIYLEEIPKQGKVLGADIVKIAVRAASREDLLRFIDFALRNRDKGLITISMGEKGFTIQDIHPSAGLADNLRLHKHGFSPGQLSVQEMMSIFKKLKMR